MGSYAEIKKIFDLYIVPQCVDLLEEMPEMGKADAYDSLTFIREVVENEIRSPLHLLDEDWGAETDLRKFADSVDEFIIYINDKISQVYDNKKDDVELGRAHDKKQVDKAVAQWKWLENRYTEMVGSWPEN